VANDKINNQGDALIVFAAIGSGIFSALALWLMELLAPWIWTTK